ncbi:MAG TPA: CCA tRNA nucleotidyltransferase [Planctomycetota bacterium]|nr:CCA tRNA nucleotidyltransferase [Planctomycetota bacterium]
MDAYALEHFPEAVKVVSRLREKGHEAYFAGGYFRDRFLGRRPNDVDVATSAEPGQVQAIFTRTVPVGVQFGVIKAVFGDEHVEIATFREDEGYTDGRRPTGVKFSGPEADARRRDFTINGVFWDPVTEKSLDFVGGEEDLVKGVVRAIGDPDARFDEDRLRILRAPRFAGRLGFRIDAATAESARRRAKEVTVVSAERIREELEKMLLDPERARSLALVRSLGLGPVVLPQLDQAALDRAERVLAELPRRKLERPLVWAALLGGIAEKAADELLAALRASNADREEALALLRDEPRVRAFGAMRLADQKRLLLRADAPLLIELGRAVALATTGDLEPLRAATLRRTAFLAETGPSALSAPPLVRGNDLKDLGIKPGPRFKELLALAEDARLEGLARTQAELVAWLRANRPDFFA